VRLGIEGLIGMTYGSLDCLTAWLVWKGEELLQCYHPGLANCHQEALHTESIHIFGRPNIKA